ncbi:hypothetical protein PRIPAC_73274 [Pristionchus pacificus]|uniref:Uncharacterized protein n=1 Tax=Pristionchus pacificus TaxID=54126 RepID=A0A2A6CSI7_PRIPA|nr:hypothetical protein PRIPAC_73274 [Pristionchus pacificus]|eukprot:PDM81174.1 hypothetical protein PRIPAC_36177 [Pristionchus pacificus]
MPKASNYWSKNRRAGGNHHNNHNNNNNNNHHNSQQGGNSNHHHNNGEKGGGGREQAHHGSTNHHHHHGREGGAGGGGGGQAGGGANQQGGAQNKRATPCVRSRSELRRILHDKLEWNEKTTALDLTLLVCADESDPAEAELIVVSSGCVATTTRYVRSDIVEAQRRREKEERATLMPDALPVKVDIAEVVQLPPPLPLKTIDEKKQRSNCEDCSIPSSVPLAPLPPLPVIAAPPGDELFRFDPSSKTHKCKVGRDQRSTYGTPQVLNQIARSVQKAWCGLLFVPAYQLGQATAFIRALNPKPDSSHYVDGYISRLCCLEDLLWALRSARGLLNVEPPLAYSIWHSMREEDMAQLSEYSELTCTCVIATLHERAQSPPSLLDGSELWPSVVVTNRNCAPPRLPWPISPPETTPIDELFNDEV